MSVRPTIVVVLAAFIVACDGGATRLVSDVANKARPTRDVSPTADLTTFFGPRQFSRTVEQPDQYEVTFSTTGYEAPFILHVQNGDGPGTRVTSATIAVDGAAALSPSDFSKQATSFAVAVSPAPTATLALRISGAPGSFLTVWLEGHRIATHFCSSGYESGPNVYSTMPAAIDATPDGGTILVCDGTNLVSNASLGSKSLTIMSEHPHQGVLDAGGAPSVFAISTGTNATTAAIRLEDRGGLTDYDRLRGVDKWNGAG